MEWKTAIRRLAALEKSGGMEMMIIESPQNHKFMDLVLFQIVDYVLLFIESWAVTKETLC